jgi:ankyrin repeat protein
VLNKVLSKPYAKPSVNCTYEDLQTPLHFGCISSDHKIIALLVKHNANVNAKNRLRRTPLHYASQIEEDMFASHNKFEAESQVVKTIKLLLSAGML